MKLSPDSPELSGGLHTEIERPVRAGYLAVSPDGPRTFPRVIRAVRGVVPGLNPASSETNPQPSASDQGEHSLHQLSVWPGQRFEDCEMVGPVDRQQMPRQSAPGPCLGVAARLPA